ncbi:hypothetical protein Vadar_033193 [Vaccinium darrowii]|uniref:Uncharacterized protein n=1 Tax=Vaccinium darrowii TaxID=229202 RepID=A0ACB7Z0N8_9ERIC|nr:hypothetical protein Vadar_033193 [Vaccinium darrowii]
MDDFLRSTIKGDCWVEPYSVELLPSGELLVLDSANNNLCKISAHCLNGLQQEQGSRGGGHLDGPSEDAKFSNVFDVIYIGNSCSLLVIDRKPGNSRNSTAL